MPTLDTVEPWIALRISQMRETVESLADAGDVPSLLHRILDRVRQVLRADLPAIVLLDDSGNPDQLGLPDIDGQSALSAFIADSELLRTIWSGEHAVRLSRLPAGVLSFGSLDVEAFIGAPIRLAGRPLGALLGFRRPGEEPFSTLDELAAVTLALQTAAHVAGVTAGERLQRVVLLEERHRISAEIQNGIVDALRAQADRVNGLADDITALSPDRVRDLGTRLCELADGVGHYAAALNAPARSPAGDLGSDLGTLLREVVPEGVNTILQVNFGPGRHPTPRLAEDILFIAREAVTNAVHHGRPTRIAVDVRGTESELIFAVQDDGVGLNVDRVEPSIGLLALQNRVERSGGSLNLIGVPGMGTVVHVRIPTAQHDE